MGETNPRERFELGRRKVLAAMAGGVVAGGFSGVGSAAQDADTLTVVHDTHFHGRFEDSGDPELNLARYYTVVQDLLESNEDAVFLGNGDDLAPSLMGLEYEGEHMVEALNAMEPDAVGAGNHEFDFGVDVAQERFEASEFPWVIANLLTDEGEPVPGTERWTTVEAGDHTVGVFGLGTESFHSITDYPEDWQVLGNVEAAEEAVAALDEEGADFVVCASHVSSGVHRRLAENVDGLDAIVGSHSGVVYDEPETSGDTVVSEFGDEFDHLGRLTFDVESGELVDWERVDFYNSEALGDDEDPPAETEHVRPVDVQEVEGDGEIADIVDEWLGKLEDRLGQPYFETEVELDATFDTNYARESRWGNLMTDAMRQVQDVEADVAVQNAGGIRSDSTYGPGEITGLDVMDVLPFPNEIEVYEVTGAQLREYLEGVTRPLPNQFGAQPAIQVSGLQYEWRGHDGEAEILSVHVGGEPVEDDETYLVSTNDFVAGRSVIGDGELVLQSGQFQGPFVLDKLEERGTVAPELEHRMIRVDEDVGPASSVERDGDAAVVSVSSTEAAADVVPESFRAVSRTGESVEATDVSAGEDELAVTFDAEALGELAASVDAPNPRVFGGFDPDDDHYGYETDDGETLDLPASAGYDYFRLRSALDAEAVRAAVEGDETTESDTETTTAETTEAPMETAETTAEADNDGGVPGFGPIAGAAGVAGGSYLYSKYGGAERADEE